MNKLNQTRPQPKLPQITILKTTQKKLAMVGISQKLVGQTYPFDWNMIVPISLLTAGVSFVCVFIFNYANTFAEYTQGIFFGAAGASMIFMLLALIFNADKLFEVINLTNTIVHTSEYLRSVVVYFFLF